MFNFHEFFHALCLKFTADEASKLISKFIITKVVRKAEAWCWLNLRNGLQTTFRWLAALLDARVTISFQPVVWAQKIITWSLIPLMWLVSFCTTYLAISRGQAMPLALLIGFGLAISGNLMHWVLNKTI